MYRIAWIAYKDADCLAAIVLLFTSTIQCLIGIFRLRSGQEGTYPELVKTAENQLKQISPDSRVLRVETPALTKESFSNEEWKSLEEELLSWEKEMSVIDKGLDFEKQRFDTVGNKNLPEVRKIVEKKNDRNMRREPVSAYHLLFFSYFLNIM